MNLLEFINQPCVYMITHIPTGSVYVGSTGRLSHRYASHLRSLKQGQHHSSRFQEVFDGEHNLELSYVLCIDRQAAYRLEQVYLERYNRTGQLLNMNIRPGGWTEEVSARVSETLRQRPQAVKDVSIKALRDYQPHAEHWVGRKHRPETIQKMREANTPAKQQQVAALIERVAVKVYAEGKTYNSLSEAARAYGMSQPGFRHRCRSDKPEYAQFYFL